MAGIRQLLASRRSPGMLLAERLRDDSGVVGALAGSRVRQESFPLIRLQDLTWDAWLATKSANFRQQARRRERRLAREHELEYRLVTDPDAVPAALDTVVELHDDHWQGASEAFSPTRRAFHHDFVKAASHRGWTRIWIATVDGVASAAWLGYRFGQVDSYYQMGRSQTWDCYNLGFLLLLRTIRDATEAGIGEYRLLVGNEPYKSRLATEDPGVVTCVAGDGMYLRAIQGVVRHKRRIPSFARRAVASELRW